MNAKQLAKWKKKRERGFNFYILFNGALCWGGLTGTLSYIAMNFSYPGEYSFPFILIAFLIGGLIWGIWTWNANEEKYSKQTEK